MATYLPRYTSSRTYSGYLYLIIPTVNTYIRLKTFLETWNIQVSILFGDDEGENEDNDDDDDNTWERSSRQVQSIIINHAQFERGYLRYQVHRQKNKKQKNSYGVSSALRCL